MLEERVLKQLGLTSLTVHDLEAGKAKYAELEKDIKGLEGELAKLDAEGKLLLERRNQAAERLGEEKQRQDEEVTQAKEALEKAADYQEIVQKKLDFELQEAEYKTGYRTGEKIKSLRQELNDAAAKKEAASARLLETEREYASAMKEVNKLDQEYNRINKQYIKIDKQLSQLRYLSSELFRELDRLERNKEYFLNKEK